MKKIISVILTVLIGMTLLVGCSSSSEKVEYENNLDRVQKTGKLIVAMSPDWPPSAFLDMTKDGQDAVIGCEVELAKYIANELGVELVIEQMDFNTCLASIPLGQVDLSLAGYSKKPERAENMECSIHYNWGDEQNAGHGLIVSKENKDLYSTPEAMSGKTIAAQAGSIQYGFVEDQLPDDVIIEPVTNTGDAILLLVNGKVDAISSSVEQGLRFCENYDTLTMSDLRFDYESDGPVALAKKGETELMAEVDKAIQKAMDEGKLEVWFAEASELARELGVDAE